MHFQMAYVNSNSQVFLKKFSQSEEEMNPLLLDFADLPDNDAQAIIYDQDIESEDTLSSLQKEFKYTPVNSSGNLSLSPAKFKELNFQNAKDLLSSMQEGWILKNNISLLEELVQVFGHLKSLWPDDRMNFFEELWFLLRSNLGARELNIIFNDLQYYGKSGDRKKLISLMMSGQKTPATNSSEELTEQLMQHYKRDFGPVFELGEYNADKGELTIIASVNNDPILIIAKVFQFNRLQQALIKTLFDGLQSN